MSLIVWRAALASLVIALAAATVTMGFIWPLLGDPYLVPLVIGAVVVVGTAIGGTTYLFLSVKR